MARRAGYASPAYAESLSEFGVPRRLSGSGGSVLERAVPGSSHRDAMGPYPLFACDDWGALREDLAALRNELVAITLVADPFGAHDPDELRRSFDRVTAFKEHFVVDLTTPAAARTHAHHRRNAVRAAREVTVDRCAEPPLVLDECCSLYANLVRRHSIRGIAAFSRTAFAKQLGVPGVAVFRATRESETVGMTIWFVDYDLAYYHLGAYSDTGYRVGASFALFSHALEHFAATGVRWVDLGARAGIRASTEDGLTRFKQGWATATRTAYLCASVLDHSLYAELAATVPGQTDYFPAYRAGEFGTAAPVS